MVDKDVLDKAEEAARILGTDVESVFKYAAYWLIKNDELTSVAWVNRRISRQIYRFH